MYILVFFWWGSFAGVTNHLEFTSKKACEQATIKLETLNHSSIAGEFSSVCLRRD